MRSIKRAQRPVALAIAGLSLASVVACGDGSSNTTVVSDAGTPAPAPAPAPAPVTTTPLDVSVIDGAIRNATVCLDRNANAACDADEPAARTNDAGRATLTVANDDLNKFAVLAIVGTDAVDADYGPVTVPFVMSTPAEQPSVVSPLTTLVHAQSRAAGQSVADAERHVKTQLGLNVSLFGNYTAAGSADDARAATVARLVVLTGQQQAKAVAGVLGQADASGTAVTQADLDTAVQRAVLDLLPDVATAASDPAITGAANRSAALEASAASLVANQSTLNAGTAAQTIGIGKLIAQDVAASATAPVAVPAASGSLRMFQYADASNWTYRSFLSTASDATPDSTNTVRYYEQRGRNTAGSIVTTGWQSDPARANETFWSGSAWTTCPLGTRGTNTLLDAAGTTRSGIYCKGYLTNFTRRANVDISGQTMTSVVQRIRQLPGTDSGIAYSQFGPSNLGALGTATFPAGSILQYQESFDTAPRAFAYDPRSSNAIAQTIPAVAAGGASSASPAPACAAITLSTPTSEYVIPAPSLDSLIAANKGTPCIYAPGTDSNGTSGSRNEWWSNSTLSIGTIANAAVRPAGTGNYYQTSSSIRVGFTGPGAVTYYQCLLRTTGGSARNCNAIGTGQYTVATMGDARVVTLSNPPAATSAFTYERVFIERGGSVYFGYRSKSASSQVAQLNLTAGNAMFATLGVPALTPQ